MASVLLFIYLFVIENCRRFYFIFWDGFPVGLRVLGTCSPPQEIHVDVHGGGIVLSIAALQRYRLVDSHYSLIIFKF